MKPLRTDDPRQLGRYRLLRRIGEGGMGVVFLAVPTSSDEGDDLVAVKAVRSEYAGDREFRTRFAGEVDLARRVRGPYTARVLDADTDGPRPWLATEYVAGPALSHAVRDNGPLPEESLLALAAGLAKALSAIHAVGLIHRDLKPSNVLLSPRGPQVLDFGIARATDATAFTRTGQTLGTPAYMSPEQATGAELDPRSDLFSFGGVLLFSATGRQPFGTGNPSALLYRVVNEHPDLSGVPGTLLPIVTACLAKDPADRPDLNSVTAELTGTALPGHEDADATEWLPEAVATTIQHTLVAVTEAIPTTEPAERDRSADTVPAPPASPPSSHGAESLADPSPKDSGGREHRPFSSTVLWGAVVATAVLASALLALGSSEGTAPQAQPNPIPQETDGPTSSRFPSPSSTPTNAPPFDISTEVQDTAFLGDPNRFAALSNAGLDVFASGDPEPIERLTERNESFHFSNSELASTPDGAVVAVKAVKSASDGVAPIHVWEIDESG
ncbi:serine/threonine-protein kinase, partial [Nocardiopsis halotolerans]|uniref:serine/threonine-protein kinase n=1 Tax=Nocardiopsis halotolerans TaxID=124252 RepID=UPI000475792C